MSSALAPRVFSGLAASTSGRQRSYRSAARPRGICRSSVRPIAGAQTYSPQAYARELARQAELASIRWQQPETRRDWQPATALPASGSKQRQRLEAWFAALNDGPCALDVLDDIASSNLTFSDALVQEDIFRLNSVKRMLTKQLASHPLLHYEVEDVITDPERGVAVAHYRAICADLLPHADGTPASGRLSEIRGVDEFHFDDQGKIRSVASFRERFIDEQEPAEGFHEGEQL